MSDKAVKRRYDNAGRAARAAANRAAVLRAGQEVLVEKGYGGATMAAIARAAGVSVETVYKGFGSKIELVGQILDQAVVGDDAPVPLIERADFGGMLQAESGAEILAEFCRASCRILERIGPLIGALFIAARAGEPELRALMAEAGRRRLADFTRVVEAVARSGALHPDLDVTEASESLWTVGSPEVYVQFRDDLGWSHERYQAWLIRSARALLLVDAQPPG
ncbi:TetR/AcrR family transcriptional regulator [Pseudonocardia sp. CA-107938]|uniref:TetR/AcrR family transcriptional regulator n=1 Tax=Pseudonocardia sp. CA-107938 TaxID=3240021 RepID=UPI003D8E869B